MPASLEDALGSGHFSWARFSQNGIALRYDFAFKTSPRRREGWHAIHTKEKKVTDREQYTPGPASGAQVRKDGEKWTLILVRELRHSPEKVWQALTDPRICASGRPLRSMGTWVWLEPR
jgi:hypothetical protein